MDRKQSYAIQGGIVLLGGIALSFLVKFAQSAPQPYRHYHRFDPDVTGNYDGR